MGQHSKNFPNVFQRHIIFANISSLIPSFDLLMYKLMITFASCYMMDEARGRATFPNCRIEFNCRIVLSPFFWECPTWGSTLQKNNLAYGTYGGGGAKQFAIFHDLF